MHRNPLTTSLLVSAAFPATVAGEAPAAVPKPHEQSHGESEPAAESPSTAYLRTPPAAGQLAPGLISFDGRPDERRHPDRPLSTPLSDAVVSGNFLTGGGYTASAVVPTT